MKCPTCNKEMDKFANSKRVDAFKCLYCKQVVISLNNPSLKICELTEKLIETAFREKDKR